MKTDVEALRKKYMDNPPEGLTSTDIRHMSEEAVSYTHLTLPTNSLV